MAIASEIERIEIMQNLGTSHANLVAMALQIKECSPGTVVFREKEECQYIYFVLSGSVSLEIDVPELNSVQIQSLGPGELLGWSPILGLGPMTATARTIDMCRIAALDVDRLLAICEHDPAFGMAFMRQMAITLANRLKATRLRLSNR